MIGWFGDGFDVRGDLELSPDGGALVIIVMFELMLVVDRIQVNLKESKKGIRKEAKIK